MASSTRFVLDASIALTWGFDESDSYAASIRDRMDGLRALVPSLWKLEMANALVTGERRGRISVSDADRFLLLLQPFRIEIDAETDARAWTDTLHLARTQRLSAYDAAYLELALRARLPLASLDVALLDACERLGVPRFKP